MVGVGQIRGQDEEGRCGPNWMLGRDAEGGLPRRRGGDTGHTAGLSVVAWTSRTPIGKQEATQSCGSQIHTMKPQLPTQGRLAMSGGVWGFSTAERIAGVLVGRDKEGCVLPPQFTEHTGEMIWTQTTLRAVGSGVAMQMPPSSQWHGWLTGSHDNCQARKNLGFCGFIGFRQLFLLLELPTPFPTIHREE